MKLYFWREVKMNKREFLEELNKKLEVLSNEEKEAALNYYEDYFADAGEENEQSVLAELESVDKVAESILKENQKEKIDISQEEKKVDENAKVEISTKPNSIITILLMVLLAALFFPVIVPAFFILLGLGMGLLVIGLVFLIVSIALFVFGIACLFVMPASGIIVIGASLVFVSFGILIMGGTIFLIKKIPVIIRGTVSFLKTILRKVGVQV